MELYTLSFSFICMVEEAWGKLFWTHSEIPVGWAGWGGVGKINRPRQLKLSDQETLEVLLLLCLYHFYNIITEMSMKTIFAT